MDRSPQGTVCGDCRDVDAHRLLERSAICRHYFYLVNVYVDHMVGREVNFYQLYNE